MSVIVINGSQCTSPWEFDFKTFVFDINNGKKLNYDEIIRNLKLNTDEVKNKIINEMIKLLKKEYGQNAVDLYGEKSKELLNNSIDNNTINIYIDNDGQLNAFVLLYYPDVQSGESTYYNVKIKK